MPSAAKSQNRAVIGSIGPATPPLEPARRRGRKSRSERALHPYTVYRDKRTQGFYIRFTDPVTKKLERRPLCREGPRQTATKLAAEAERLAAKIWEERLAKAGRVAAGIDPEREVRIKALVPLYLEHVRTQDITPEAKRDYGRHMKRWVLHTAFSRVADVRHIDGAVLHSLAAELLKVTRNNRRTRFKDEPFTRKMVRAHLVTLSAFFRWVAECHGVNVANPIAISGILAHFPKGGRGEDHFYRPEEVDAFLRTVDKWRYTSRTIGNREIAYTLAYTGARIGEVLRLRVSAIDFGANMITFENLKRTADEKAAGLRKTRTLAMWPRLRSVLLEYIRRHGLKGDDLLFPMFIPAPERIAARPARSSGPYEWLQSVCASASIPYRSGHHVWRHTYISARARMHKRLAVLGQPGVYTFVPVSLEDIQAEVGHVDGSSVTQRVYKHSTIQMPRIAVHELDWALLADALRQQREEDCARFGQGYHEADVERMTALASPALLCQVAKPPAFR